MKILAVELSSPRAELAFRDEERGSEDVVAWDRSRDMTRHLFSEIEGLLKRHGVLPGELDLLVNGQGPGNFSGMRAGQASLEGLALPCGIPVIGVSSGRALAWRLLQDSPELPRVGILGDARRGTFWLGTFTQADVPNGCPADWKLVPADELIAAMKDLSGLYAPEFERTQTAVAALSSTVAQGIREATPSALDLAALAREELRQGRPHETLAPLYLHSAV